MPKTYKNRLCRISILLMLIFGFTGQSNIRAAELHPEFPRLSNYFLRAGQDIKNEMIPLLARYDLLILPAETQVWNPQLFPELRRLNPEILLLAYVPTLSFAEVWDDPLHDVLAAGIREEWWLRDEAGRPISVWPRTRALDLTGGWGQYLANFTTQQIWRTGRWDGVFFDEVGRCFVCNSARRVDLDRDGQVDDGAAVDAAWLTGTRALLENFRRSAGEKALVITNGSSEPSYQPYVNGRMFESFPTPWEADGGWAQVMQSFEYTYELARTPKIFVLDGDTGNTGLANDYRDVRFGLVSALLGNGYFGYSRGTQNHGQLWWYDEFNVTLGRPRGAAVNLSNMEKRSFASGIWRRDFEHGIVLLNSTAQTDALNLGEEFEKIHGLQDARANNGSISSRVRLPAEDGLILLRIVETLKDVTAPNGAFARVLDREGKTVRTGFFIYDPRAPGGHTILNTDMDGDGAPETLSAGEGRVRIWKGAQKDPLVLAPYGEDYRGTIELAVGDTNGDGHREIITGAGKGAGPHIRLFGVDGRLLSPGFFAFEKRHRRGIHIAAGDTDGDGSDEIIVGDGAGGQPVVRIFRADGTIVQNGFPAYHPSFRGGVRVAADDLDGDAIAEIITGAGFGGGPHVRIFNGQGQSSRGFFPYDKNQRSGVFVGATDMEGDGSTEIIALSTDIL